MAESRLREIRCANHKCGVVFTASKSTQKYCSSYCREDVNHFDTEEEAQRERIEQEESYD